MVELVSMNTFLRCLVLILVNFNQRSGSSSSLVLYLFLMASMAENPVSHGYDVLNGIKNFQS
jgi:hypothetical protein